MYNIIYIYKIKSNLDARILLDIKLNYIHCRHTSPLKKKKK